MIIGSGIFVSPVGVVRQVGSVGASLLVWLWCGVSSTLLALCYAEIGTLIPISGGEYAYVREIFGPFPAFLILWMNVTLLAPVTVAVSGSVFATYVVKPLFPECSPPLTAVKLLAAAVILLVAAVNVVGVKFATKIQLVFTASKLLALSIVVGVGIYHLALYGNSAAATASAVDVFGSWDRLWEDSSTDPSAIAVAILSGFWAFGGWNYLNFLTGELKQPERNLPLSILIGMAIVTIFYLLANIAYFAVLPPRDMLQSAAVAVTFAEKARLPLGAILTPLFVAASVFGAMNGQVLGSSRVYVQGAVDGQLPRALAMISVAQLTPTPALALIAALSVFLTVFFDVFVLISYFGLVSCLMIFATLLGLLYWRWTQPERRSPVTTPIVLPVAMLIYVTALIVLTIRRQFWDSLIGLGIVVTGLPVYFLFVRRADDGGGTSVKSGKDCAGGSTIGKERDDVGGVKANIGVTDVGPGKMTRLTVIIQKLLGVIEQEDEASRKNN